jgi:hypothetical protein
MTQDSREILARFHRALVREIRAQHPEYLEEPFTVAEIYQNLVPYRTHRDEIGVEMNADYEHALLQLLAGEGDFLTMESRTARQEIREELDSPNPNTGLYRDFAAADVRLNPERMGEMSERWEGPGGDGQAAETGPLLTESEGPYLLVDLNGEPDQVGEVDAGEESSGREETPPGPLEIDSEAAPSESRPGVLPPEDPVAAGEDEFVEEEESTVEVESLVLENCPWCRENLPDQAGVRFCPFCGSNVQLVPCPDCGEELETTWRFCIACGTEISK